VEYHTAFNIKLRSVQLGSCQPAAANSTSSERGHAFIIPPFSFRRRLVLDRCMRLFPPRESSYWIYISSAERLEHLSVADNPHFGLEDLQLTYELENLRSLNLSGCSALTSDALLVNYLLGFCCIVLRLAGDYKVAQPVLLLRADIRRAAGESSFPTTFLCHFLIRPWKPQTRAGESEYAQPGGLLRADVRRAAGESFRLLGCTDAET